MLSHRGLRMQRTHSRFQAAIAQHLLLTGWQFSEPADRRHPVPDIRSRQIFGSRATFRTDYLTGSGGAQRGEFLMHSLCDGILLWLIILEHQIGTVPSVQKR